MSDHESESVPTICLDCGAALIYPSDGEGDEPAVLRQCTECAGYYTAHDGWVSEEEIQAVLKSLRERATQIQGSPSGPSAPSDETPQAVHDLREELSLEAANAIPEHTDLTPDEQSELLRRLTLAIHKTTNEYLQSRRHTTDGDDT